MIKCALALLGIVLVLPLSAFAQNDSLNRETTVPNSIALLNPESEQSLSLEHVDEILNVQSEEKHQLFNPTLFDLHQNEPIEITHEEVSTFFLDSEATTGNTYSRGKALGFAALIPGAGHLYTKRSRGYLYLAGSILAAGMYMESYFRFVDAESKKNRAVDAYNAASNTDSAAFFRSEVFRLQDEEKKFQDMSYFSLGLFGAIYAAQLIDLFVSTSSNRNTPKSTSRIQAGIAPGTVQLNFTF